MNEISNENCIHRGEKGIDIKLSVLKSPADKFSFLKQIKMEGMWLEMCSTKKLYQDSRDLFPRVSTAKEIQRAGVFLITAKSCG